MAPYLHSTAHISIDQGETAGCQLLALSQYLITVQLCREKETFHLPVHAFNMKKAFITFIEAWLRFSEKLSKWEVVQRFCYGVLSALPLIGV